MRRLSYAFVGCLFIMSLLVIILIDDPYYFRHGYLLIAVFLSYSVGKYSNKQNVIPTFILAVYLNIYCLLALILYVSAKTNLFDIKYWFIQFVLPAIITASLRFIMKKNGGKNKV